MSFSTAPATHFIRGTHFSGQNSGTHPGPQPEPCEDHIRPAPYRRGCFTRLRIMIETENARNRIGFTLPTEVVGTLMRVIGIALPGGTHRITWPLAL